MADLSRGSPQITTDHARRVCGSLASERCSTPPHLSHHHIRSEDIWQDFPAALFHSATATREQMLESVPCSNHARFSRLADALYK